MLSTTIRDRCIFSWLLRPTLRHAGVTQVDLKLHPNQTHHFDDMTMVDRFKG